MSLFSTEPEEAPSTWPAGFHPPPPRARVIAMVIDLVVLFVLTIGVQTAGGRIIDNVYREQTDALDVADETVDDAEDARDRAEDRADEARDDAERAERQGDVAAEEEARQRARTADAEADEAEEEVERAEDEISDLQGELFPGQLAVLGAILGLALLYLVPSSVVRGRSLGKQLLGIRVINADGTRLGLRGALVHYGAPVAFALVFQLVLGQLVVLIVLIGVLTWPRNANRQGMHDRLAQTLVVDG